MMIEISIEQYIDMASRLAELEWRLGEAVQVVRCGECRHKYMKDFDMFCPYMVGILKPNMHCSYGEREGE